LIEETTRDPRGGIGKPEPLKGEHGVWSRRMTEEHRLTYRVSAEHVDFLQARFHYDA
jgi:toxin YoeB